MNYQVEFPDFSPADMPAIPAGWVDTSWKNDICPSFTKGNLRLWVDYADAARREFPESSRFGVTALTTDGDYSHTVLETDDFEQLLADIADAGL